MNILITGGACAGKTTCIEYMKKYLQGKNYKVVVFEEIPTKMINNGETPNKLGNMNFIKEVIKRQLEQMKQDKDGSTIYIYDGSPIDIIKFIAKDELVDILKMYNTDYNEVLNYFDYVIHLESVAKSLPEEYSNQTNKARTPDVSKSAERDDLLFKAYENHSKRFYVKAYKAFDKKMEEFRKIIDGIFNI